MPSFENPFAGNKAGKTLSDAELIRAIRFNIAAEYEAIQFYMQLAESTNNALVKKVLVDIADEEREHAGEFLQLLHILAPDEQGFYDHGAGEVKEMAAELKAAKKKKSKKK